MNRNIHISRTNPEHLDFRKLIVLLDDNLSANNGEDQAFFTQFNKTDTIKHAIVAYIDGNAVGCGAIKEFGEGTMEVKRMFVHPDFRRQGIAKKVLEQLEIWANELGYETCILETGNKQTEAVSLYQNLGYEVIPNYGQYENVESSICMQKKLKDLSSAV
ncbi:Acetyltransferase (GNAT) domain-containing protein [Pedobacter steynii]|uniref:Acetyltransferase (GNAT) domain-containing protein n=1 Tax=Pedobacter steynii TaxID=430522 RepID=A0A1G9YFZ0_9SPHI|nr:GNAT family N-acetyltransferase [Pedobacter steynii]NQX39693.1 GNAT family N-acetyltransferase [Pedobacter steynii]SDN07393.1 Acetyltransferase (GNAT) domain-containing protein [Pedobacter steynii]